jgi:hypothetical protein
VAAFLANVGVNSSHAARSPLFADGTFRLLPIPEARPWRPPMVRLAELTELAAFAPNAWRKRAVHLDPDLESATPTYGDNCRRAGRAFSLRRAASGDVIVFIARLHPTAGPAAFHLVGCLHIDDVLVDVEHDPGSGWWDGNAHVRRARATSRWDSFWIFKGANGSRLFDRAVAFARPQLEALLGEEIRWRSNRTELQTIGSCTRAVRRIEGQGEEWLRAICQS